MLDSMDREGSGQEAKSREQLEEDLETGLSASGWENRAAAIVLDPELEVWIWTDSPHVDHELGWSGQKKRLRSWLRVRSLWRQDALKPDRPKEAMEATLKHVRKPRSSAIYQSLAEKVGLTKCVDPAFLKLRSVLLEWFPAEG
jgi:hypothetical protein